MCSCNEYHRNKHANNVIYSAMSERFFQNKQETPHLDVLDRESTDLQDSLER